MINPLQRTRKFRKPLIEYLISDVSFATLLPILCANSQACLALVYLNGCIAPR
jgi:hypothetical protein